MLPDVDTHANVDYDKPFIPAAHTQIPAYALAERAADLVKAAH